MRSNLAKVLLILLVLVATVAALTACAPNSEEVNAGTVLESIDIEGGNSITIEEGNPFDPAAYTLVAELSDGSRVRVPMSVCGLKEEELEYLNSAGDHTLTVTYIFNGIEKSILFNVKVEAKVIEPTKYTVKFVMPVYDEQQYGKQLQDEFVSTLTKPYIELNEGDPTYLAVEWYTRAEFTPNTEVSFPLQLTANNTVDGVLTIYGKAIDSRKINVRYFQRTVRQDGSVVEKNPFYSDSNKYSYGDNHRTLSLDGVITYNNGIKVGFETPYFEIYNYLTGSFDRLEFNTDFKIENKYIEPSKLNDEEIDVAVETVYNISRFTVLLQADKNANGTIDDGEEFYLSKDYKWSATPSETNYFYYNETLSASSIPTAELDDLQVKGKNLSWTGYKLAGYDTVYVTGNLVLTGVYSDVTYDVFFYRDSGNIDTSFSVPYGATVGSQVTLTKLLPQLKNVAGYTFKWEYYLDADDKRYDITDNAIADIIVTGALRVYETKTANVYNSTFRYMTGNTVRFEKTVPFSFADKVEFPTVSELQTALPEYNSYYFGFIWLLGVSEVNTSIETQRATATVYDLSVSDLRRLTVTAVLPDEFSRSGKAIERQFCPVYFDTGSSVLSSVSVEVSSFAFDIIESHKYNAFYTDESLSEMFDGETVRFNKNFWTGYETVLDVPVEASEDGYFDFGLKLYMGCAVRTFEVEFYEQLSSNAATRISATTVNYGESPEKPTGYDTADRMINGEVYSFYGWYSMPDDINSYVSDADFSVLETKLDLRFYAKWLSAKEGTYGVIYEDYNGYYAAVDYQGSADEVRIATEINGRNVNGVAAELFFLSNVGSEVTAVYLHSGIEFVEQGAFTPCNSLENIFVNGSDGKYLSDNGVLYMDNGDGTFTLVKYPILKNSNGNYTLPANTTAIADEAFIGYRGTGINLGSTLKEIGASAFRNAKLQAVTLPASLETVGEQAFYNAEDLETVTVSGNALANVKKFGKEVFGGTAWFNAQAASQIILGGVLLTVIDDSDSITLDNNVIVIADSAFVGLKATLKSFAATANSQLKIIGSRAFEGCSLLSSVSILSTKAVVVVDGNSFKTTASELRVTVDSSMLNDYCESSYWRAALGANISKVIFSA